jgi:hypothetical protein
VTRWIVSTRCSADSSALLLVLSLSLALAGW